MAADYWAHYYRANPDTSKEAIDDEFDMAAEMAKADEEASGLPDDFEDC